MIKPKTVRKLKCTIEDWGRSLEDLRTQAGADGLGEAEYQTKQRILLGRIESVQSILLNDLPKNVAGTLGPLS